MPGDDLADALARIQAQRSTAAAYVAGLNKQQIDNVTGIAAAYPNLGAAALPLGVAGVPAGHPTATKAAAAKVLADSRQVQAGKETSGGFMSKLWASVKDRALKPIVRYGSAAAAAPYEFMQATFREGVAGVRDGDPLRAASPFGLTGLAAAAAKGRLDEVVGQTTVGAGAQVARDRGRFGIAGSGSGWFMGPDTDAGRRQARNARTAALIDGRAVTPGRLAASLLPIEPGTGAYNVVSGMLDMGSTLAFDPLTYVGGGVAKVSRARRVITSGPARAYEIGVVDGGIRKTVLPERAIRWLDSEKASQVITKMAAEKDFERLRRATGKKLPTSLLVDLVDANDPLTVKNLLVDAIGKGSVRERAVFKAKPDDTSRLLGMMPANRIDLDDIDDSVEQLDRFQRNVRMDPAVISKNNEALARAGSKGTRFEVVKTVLDTVRGGLEAAGVPKAKARSLTQAFEDAYDDSRRYFIDATGDNAHIPGAVIGGTGKPLPAPHLSTELIERYVPLPNARDLKAATRDVRLISKMQGTLGYRAVRDFADFTTNDLFKTFALALRPAWTVRVVGEEQVRMGAAGLSSAFRHPLSYMAWVAGEKPGKLNKIMGGGRGGTDALGGSFIDDIAEGVTDFQRALNRGSAGWRNRVNIASRHWTTYSRDEEPYVASWQDELTQLMSDPVAREVARKGTESARRSFMFGNLQGVREELQAARPEMGLDDAATAGRYIETVADRISVKTGGHPAVLDAIRTGKLEGHPLVIGTQPNPKAKRVLERLRDEGVGPPVVKGQVSLVGQDGTLTAMARNYDRAAEFMFNALGSVPTNKLSRSATFRQSYWKRIEELAPMLARNDRARLARQAKEAGLDRATVNRLKATVAHEQAGTLSLEDADRVSKAFGLGETRRLLYSLHDKRQAADALRVVFPFGEAWWEVLSRWTMLGAENPLVPYRASQGLQEGEGVVFAPDPVTGQEMINLPGSQWITEKLVGVPVKMDMPLKGLNMFGQVLPGVGPVVSIPAGKLIPDDPGADWLRNMVMPYGEQDISSGAFESFLPPYLKKLAASVGWKSPAQQRQIASTTRDVMAYLYSTGDYNLSTPEGQDKLISDAKDKAIWVYRIRAVAQSTLPSAPTTKFAALDKDGRLTALVKLAEDYRRLQKQDYRTATERFLTKYGQGAFLAVIPKTTGTVAPTDTVNKLARQHPDVARRYPNVFGLFAPQGEVDPAEIERQVQAGTRELVGPEKAVTTANIRLAGSIYAEAVKRAGDSPDAEELAWLRDVRDRLKKDFPGYTGGFDSSKAEGSIQELIRASEDPVLSVTRAGRALTIYLQARKRAIEATRSQGLAGPFQAQAARPWRDWLRQVAVRLRADYPEFGQMYDYVLGREMVDN